MPTPAVIQYPTRSAPATRGRRANVTPGRWATIEVVIEPAEGVEVFRFEKVVNISLMIPPDRPPELPGLTGPDVITHRYFLERVALDVKIGMVRGGPVDAVGGFGYPDGSELPGWEWFANLENSGYVVLLEDI